MTRLRARLLGLIAASGLAVFLIGVPFVLVNIGADPLPDGALSWHEVQDLLTSQDDGTLLLRVVALLSWAAWAFCAATVTLEVVAQVRGVQAPKLPGLGVPQAGARVVVSAAALLFLASPVATAGAPHSAAPGVAMSATSMSTSTAQTHVPLTPSAAPGLGTSSPAQVAKSHTTQPTPSETKVTRTVTVRRGDSLWKLSEQHLGDSSRYREIKALNRDVLEGHEGFLLPGMVLRLPDAPVDAQHERDRRVTVRPGDSLSDVARDELGDADAWQQIFEASRDTRQPDGGRLRDPDLIQPGWTLTIPGHAHGAEKAEAAAKAPAAGPAAADGEPGASESEDAHADDAGAHGRSVAEEADEAREGSVAAPPPPVLDPREVPVPGISPETAAVSPSATASNAAATPQQEQPASPGIADESPVMPWAVAGLTGAGAVLAGSILLAVRMRRRAQWRARRPGRTIAAPPPELAAVEKTVIAAGTQSAATIELMDDVLRRLSVAAVANGRGMPRVAAVQLREHRLTVHLSEPADLDAPWQDDGGRLHWTFEAGTSLDRIGPAGSPDQPAPWPLLVTIGASDTGGVWLLNLEEAGTLSLSGDDLRAAGDFARYIAAELAVNPWSSQVTVNCVGVGDEVAGMNPARIHVHHDTQVTAEVLADALSILDRTAQTGTDTVAGRAGQLGDELWPAHVLLLDTTSVVPGTDDHAAVEELVQLVARFPTRTGAALVLTGEQQDPRGIRVDLTAAGRVQISSVGLDLKAVGLTSAEALGCAALLAVGDDVDDVPMPQSEQTLGWRAWSDEAGNLRPEHTLPRADAERLDAPTTGSERGLELVDDRTSTVVEDGWLWRPGQNEGDVGDEAADGSNSPAATSILDGPDEEYLRAAATTQADLQVLAPRVPADLQERVEETDPELDADLARWHSEDCPLPRLTLLGPVRARTRGNARAVAKRKPYYTELFAYLATRPAGATPAQVADAFGLTAGRVRTDITTLRDWLGVNPGTGDKHLPPANESPAGRARGVGVYQVVDVLIDADLFRRLRTRAQARGRDGHQDLLQALHLISGPPFAQLREGLWSWLSEGDRLDQHMLCAVVDVAHLVTIHALAEGDLSRARVAAEIAALAAPYEEIPRLDLAAVAEAEGHHAVAERILREEIADRSDDGEAPMDLSARTKEILRQREWLLPGKRAS